MAYTKAALKAFADQKKEKREDAATAPLGILDSVDKLIKSYRGDSAAVKAGILNLIYGAVAAAAALSCVPFEMNFGSVFAGSVLRDLINPGVSAAVSGPLVDYLDNIFPTRELNVRLLVTGIEKGALTDQEVVETAIDMGIKDREIKKLLKIAKVARFDRETDRDYDILLRYENALISAQIELGRAEVDQAIRERYARISELTRIMKAQAAQEAQA